MKMSNISYYNILRVSKIEKYNSNELDKMYTKYTQLCKKKEININENDTLFYKYLLDKNINDNLNKNDIDDIYNDFKNNLNTNNYEIKETEDTTPVIDIDVIIPKDKLNDFRYIQLQLCDVKCNILQHISKKKNISLDELVYKYIPEMNPVFFKELYTKYNLKLDNK
jgi:hypothetical protein